MKNPRNLLHFWLGAEILFFIIFGAIFGYFFSFLLLIVLSGFGIYLLRKFLQQNIAGFLKFQKNEASYKILGAFLLVLPGLISSFLAFIFLLPKFFNNLRGKIWDFIQPKEIYEHYQKVDAFNSDGEKLDAEILPGKKSHKNKK